MSSLRCEEPLGQIQHRRWSWLVLCSCTSSGAFNPAACLICNAAFVHLQESAQSPSIFTLRTIFG
ncbi:hypothetical protein E2C01_095063 [Portunus trituberculatus]|uniref:Uncharacterized protein n=1 Tax=Portunus trituberculatus TaxID=210409 RepID=A0A5B7JZ93_PORTR|nr:hypothetical protein [Portunus trituberculatus]